MKYFLPFFLLFISCSSNDDENIVPKQEVNVDILNFQYEWFVNPDIPFWYHYRMTATLRNNGNESVHGYVVGYRSDGERVSFSEYYNPLQNPLILNPNETRTITDSCMVVFSNHLEIDSVAFELSTY